jgi:hypothetical protein
MAMAWHGMGAAEAELQPATKRGKAGNNRHWRGTMPIDEETKATGMWNATRLIDERTSNFYVGIDFPTRQRTAAFEAFDDDLADEPKRYAIC